MVIVIARIVLTTMLCYLAAFYGGWWLFTALIGIALANELSAQLIKQVRDAFR